MKKSRKSLTDLSQKSIGSKIASYEFEGLLGFEEIDPCKFFNEKKYNERNKRNKQKEVKTKKIKKSKMQSHSNDDTNSSLSNSSVKRASEENIQSTSKKKKNFFENESEFSCSNEKDCVDIEAWKSIFVPSCVIDAIKVLGFKEPTAIQRLCIPAAVKGQKDIVGAAETGSGKTLSFVIPIVHGILKEREKMETENMPPKEIESCDEDDDETLGNDENLSEVEDFRCVQVIDNAQFDFFPEQNSFSSTKTKLLALIVTPTRELAMQIKKHTDAILLHTNIKTAVVIGGMAHEKQERVLSKGPEIVIGTPGRIWELVQHGNNHLAQIQFIRFLAIDETDRMLEKGHFEDLQHLLELINGDSEAAKQRQTFIFSATLTLTHDIPKRLSTKKKVINISRDAKLENLIKQIGVRGKPKIVDITRKFGTAETLSEAKIFCDKDEKDSYLYYFLQRFPGRTLIFCNSINCVRRVSNVLTLLRCKPQSLHASKLQRQRLKSLDRFTLGAKSILLATDVAARGIDIPGIDHIFHYEVPKTAETYVHRSGRTARAYNEGLSILLVESAELKRYRQLCSTLNRTSDLPSFPIEEGVLEKVKKIVDLAREIESTQHGLDKRRIGDSWLQKMAQEAGIDIGSGSDEDDDDEYESSLQIKQRNFDLGAKKARLNQLLSQPVFGDNFSVRYPTSSGKLILPMTSNSSQADKSAILLLKKGSKNNFPKLNTGILKKARKKKRKFNKI